MADTQSGGSKSKNKKDAAKANDDAPKYSFWIWAVGIYLILLTMGSIGILIWKLPETTSSFDVSAIFTSNDSTLVITSTVLVDTLVVSADTLNIRRPVILPDAAASDTTTIVSKATIDPPYPPQTMLLLVLAVGALGACLHALTSFGEYVGNKSYGMSWTLYYFLRPIIGATLAVLFFFLILGGLFTINAGNVYGIIGMAGLIGLFSKQAMDKLADIFGVLFQSDREKDRKDKLHAQLPVIIAIDPPSAQAGSTDVTIIVTGSGFVNESKVQINGQDRVTTFGSATQLTATLLDSDVAQEGMLKVTVVNPDDKGGTSKSKDFTVEQPASPP